MILTALLLAALAQDNVDNPEYKGWATFKPGSSVTIVLERNGIRLDGAEKTTLKSVSETEVVVETENIQDGATVGKPIERKIFAKAPADKQGKVLATGEEEIKLGGKKVTCRWKESESGKPSRPGTMKVWSSEEIPGMVARIEVTAPLSKVAMLASAWEKK